MSSALTLGHLFGVTGVVAFGAVVPVVPTGAAVSVAAAVGERNPFVLVLVILFGAAGAYVGDIVTYAALRAAGQPLAERVGWLKRGHAAETLQAMRTQIEERELPVLLTSRLIPGGRVPVLLAAALGGYSWRRFAVADVAAAGLWSTFYTLIGVVGRAVFPEPWQAAVAAIVLVLLVSGANELWKRHRATTAPAAPAAPGDPAGPVGSPTAVETEPTRPDARAPWT